MMSHPKLTYQILSVNFYLMQGIVMKNSKIKISEIDFSIFFFSETVSCMSHRKLENHWAQYRVKQPLTPAAI